MTKDIDRKKLLDHLQKREEALKERVERDFAGGLHSDVLALREIRYMKTWVKIGLLDKE